jgi:hypothetical protein
LELFPRVRMRIVRKHFRKISSKKKLSYRWRSLCRIWFETNKKVLIYKSSLRSSVNLWQQISSIGYYRSEFRILKRTFCIGVVSFRCN